MKNHDRNSFFKYSTAETLKIILKTKRFRWSAPKRFNDPFDHLFSISDEDTAEEHKSWFLEEAEKIVFSEQPQEMPHPSVLGLALIGLRKHAHKIERSTFLNHLEEAFEEGKRNAASYLEGVNKEWAKSIETARIFCVSEEPQNLLMWAHYAGEHSGAVIELRCIEELDTPLCAAQKVEYRPFMPKIGSFKEMFLNALGQVPMPTNKKLYYDLAYVKSEHWSYENEWRCITYREEPGDFSDFKYYPEEITNIYLGFHMKEEDKTEINSLLKGNFQHVEVYEMKVDDREYRLLSKKINS